MAVERFGQLLGALIRERREAAGMTQRDLAEESFPDQLDHEGKERRIRELELGEVSRPQARNYTPICETLNIDRTMIRVLKKQATDSRDQDDAEFNELIEDRGSLDAALSNTMLLTRSELEQLANRFGINMPETQPDKTLAQLLNNKAEEYHALRNEVEAIGETYQRLSNIKAAARDAIALGNFKEVEELLAEIMVVELEEASKTAELRAKNALLRGHVEQAFALLESASGSFSGINRSLALEKRIGFAELLFEHGINYGFATLNLLRDFLNVLPDAKVSSESLIFKLHLWKGRASLNLGIFQAPPGSIDSLTLGLHDLEIAEAGYEKLDQKIELLLARGLIARCLIELARYETPAMRHVRLDTAENKCRKAYKMTIVGSEERVKYVVLLGDSHSSRSGFTHGDEAKMNTRRSIRYYGFAERLLRSLICTKETPTLNGQRENLRAEIASSLEKLAVLTQNASSDIYYEKAEAILRDEINSTDHENVTRLTDLYYGLGHLLMSRSKHNFAGGNVRRDLEDGIDAFERGLVLVDARYFPTDARNGSIYLKAAKDRLARFQVLS